MQLFDDWIKDCYFLDLSLSNSKFTWFGPAGKRSKLDNIG